MAGPRAGLTMVHVMLCALVTAGLADVCARFTDRFSVFAASCHRCGRDRTNLSAIHVQRNTPGHHLDIGLLQAYSGAVIAGDDASITGLNAGGMNLVWHINLHEECADIGKSHAHFQH